MDHCARLDEFLSEDGLEGLHAQLAKLGPDNPLVADDVIREAPNTPGNGSNGSTDTFRTPTGPKCLPLVVT